MKIKNISVKPICIGDASLLPGDTAEVGDTFADAVGFYISMGLMDRIADTAGGLKGGCRCLQRQLKQSLSPFRRGF